MWEHGWSKEQATRAINRSAEAGFDFIEAPSLDPSSINPAITTKLLGAAGIGIAFSMGLDFESVDAKPARLSADGSPCPG